MISPLVPAEMAAAGDSTPYSTNCGDVYNSAHGALPQARNVFLPAGTLDRPEHFTGFGRAAKIDAVFLNGFAPARNPELWSPILLATLSRMYQQSTRF